MLRLRVGAVLPLRGSSSLDICSIYEHNGNMLNESARAVASGSQNRVAVPTLIDALCSSGVSRLSLAVQADGLLPRSTLSRKADCSRECERHR